MIWAVVLFAIASVACGMATSVEELVFYRIIQGASGPIGALISSHCGRYIPKGKTRVCTGNFWCWRYVGSNCSSHIGRLC